jgi:hypothetical protein
MGVQSQSSPSSRWIFRLFVACAAGATSFASPTRASAETSAAPDVDVHRHRLAVRPYFTHAIAGGSASPNALGGSLDVYITEAFALGADIADYAPFNVWRPPPLERTNETQWMATLRATLILLQGSPRSWLPEVYLLGGGGLISTRPIPVVDPNRLFMFQPRLALDAGVGVRWFITRALVLGVEAHDTIYNEHLENSRVARPNPLWPQPMANTAQDPSTWFGENQLTHRIHADLGVTLFLPFL